MKIPFNIKFRPQIESGEFKVETRDGKPARIICWDRFAIEPYDKCNIIVLVTFGNNSESAYYYYQDGHLWDKSNDEGDSNLDLFIITPEPELTEFEQELVNFFNERNAILPDKDGVYNKHDCNELLHKSANKLLELAKKEICKGCSANLEGYIKGITAANKDYQQGYMDGYKKAEEDYKQSVAYHYTSYQSPCFNGGVCTNPHHDCINCPRQSSGTTINTSGTIKEE